MADAATPPASTIQTEKHFRGTDGNGEVLLAAYQITHALYEVGRAVPEEYGEIPVRAGYHFHPWLQHFFRRGSIEGSPR